jgi:signal transduction histidine kinase
VILLLVLGVVGVASLLTARSLAKPLARLSAAARALGAGKLDARAGMARSDEIGDVAAAFDEMADRVTALLHAEKELLANVSHELRTPLARIRVALDLAAEGDAETARGLLGEIGEDLGELEVLIGDVLTAARLDLGADGGAGGQPPLRVARFDPTELVQRAASRFRAAHPERPLVVTVAPDLPSLDGDLVLLRRVVDNLLENAHRYAKGSTDPVELVAAPAADALVIEVRDHGIGIAPDDLPHVFRPFFRADRSRARATGGLGLGLALARRIVTAHGGVIELDSTLGEGTCARVRLPAGGTGPVVSSPHG